MFNILQNSLCLLFLVTAASLHADTRPIQHAKPFLVHISGTPGTGKTTLGKKLKELTNFEIVETDQFTSRPVREEKERMLKAGKTEEEIIEFVFQKYRDKFKFYNSKFPKIIYIGLLDSNVPKGLLFKEQTFDVKIFYDPGIKEVIRRYYTREVKNGILADEEFLDDVANEKDQIRGSKQLKALYEKDKTEHKEMNYQFMNEAQIIEYVKKLDKDLKKDL